MSGLPPSDLEAQAGAERERLHHSVEELRIQLRRKLDVNRNAREHLGVACGFAALASFTIGYALTGIFVD